MIRVIRRYETVIVRNVCEWTIGQIGQSESPTFLHVIYETWRSPVHVFSGKSFTELPPCFAVFLLIFASNGDTKESEQEPAHSLRPSGPCSKVCLPSHCLFFFRSEELDYSRQRGKRVAETPFHILVMYTGWT